MEYIKISAIKVDANEDCSWNCITLLINCRTLEKLFKIFIDGGVVTKVQLVYYNDREVYTLYINVLVSKKLTDRFILDTYRICACNATHTEKVTCLS